MHALGVLIAAQAVRFLRSSACRAIGVAKHDLVAVLDYL